MSEQATANGYSDEYVEQLQVEIERQKAAADYWAGEARRAADGMVELRREIKHLQMRLMMAGEV